MSELSEEQTVSPATPAGRLQREATGPETADPLAPRRPPGTGQEGGPDLEEEYPNWPADHADGASASGAQPVGVSDRTPVTSDGSRYAQAQPAGNFAGSTDEHQQDSQEGVSAAHPLVKESSVFRSRWESVQVSFVDDPRQAVSEAEALVGDVLNDLTAGFRHQRQELESRWNQGQEASTEHLRQTLQRYRDFFERLLRV